MNYGLLWWKQLERTQKMSERWFINPKKYKNNLLHLERRFTSEKPFTWHPMYPIYMSLHYPNYDSMGVCIHTKDVWEDRALGRPINSAVLMSPMLGRKSKDRTNTHSFLTKQPVGVIWHEVLSASVCLPCLLPISVITPLIALFPYIPDWPSEWVSPSDGPYTRIQSSTHASER